MTFLTVILILLAAVAGWGIFTAGLLVLREMDLRQGRWATAVFWVATTLAGAWLAVVPGYTGLAPHWAEVAIACTLAACLWQNIEVIILQAKRAARHRWVGPVIVTGLLAGCVVVAPVLAFEVRGNAFVLSEAEVLRCNREGGCSVMTQKQAFDALAEAAALGKAQCQAESSKENK